MRVIYFVGYGDYDATEFERQNFDLEKLYEEIQNGKEYIEGETFRGDLYTYEFSRVDKTFIKFVRDELQSCKNQSNFYILE